MDTTIVVCYQAGTSDMLRVCLRALARHTQRDAAIVVATAGGDDGLYNLRGEFDFDVVECDVSVENVNGIHGRILDKVIPTIGTPFFVTLDSDCFPLADGWLSDLRLMLDTARIAGVLHPWAPPPDDLPKTKLAYRIRSQHCWTSTHVACQMMRTEDYRKLQEDGAKFSGGDDTGLLVPLLAHKRGWIIDGFMPTRCPKLQVMDEGIDPEFNRMWCVVYGDKMCHIGGFTRAAMGQPRPDSANFEWAVKRIMADGGAEFLLEDRLSYKYQFNREEEVAAYKINWTFGVSADGRSLGKPQPNNEGLGAGAGRLGDGKPVQEKVYGVSDGNSGGSPGGEIPYPRPCPRRQEGLEW